MIIKNDLGLKEFLIRLGTTVVAVVLVMYLAKVWFVDPRLAVLSSQELTSEQIDTSVKTVELLQAQVLSLRKEIKALASTAQAPTAALTVTPTAKALKEAIYVGSAKSNIYHYSWCRWAKKISPRNLVTFRSVKDAKSQGKRACKVCKPPEQDQPLRVARAPTAAPTAPVEVIYKKIDTDGDGIPDTFLLIGKPQKEPASPAKTKSKIPTQLIKAACTKVNDGDTIEVGLDDGSTERIRLVGIDTPEVWRKTGSGWAEDPEPGGKEASDFTTKKVLNQTVYLDVDDQEPLDKYGRTLALVYTSQSDAKKGPRHSLNAKLLQKGLAKVLFIPPSEFDPYSWE